MFYKIKFLGYYYVVVIMISLSSEDKPDYSETFRQFFVHLAQ